MAKNYNSLVLMMAQSSQPRRFERDEEVECAEEVPEKWVRSTSNASDSARFFDEMALAEPSMASERASDVAERVVSRDNRLRRSNNGAIAILRREVVMAKTLSWTFSRTCRGC